MSPMLAAALETAALHLEEQSGFFDHATGTLLCMAREIRALIPRGAAPPAPPSPASPPGK